MWRLLEGGIYFFKGNEGVPLIRGQPLLEGSVYLSKYGSC